MSSPVNYLIIEDHTLFGIALDQLLSGIPNLVSLGVLQSHVNIGGDIDGKKPGLIFLDLHMPEKSGFDILEDFQKRGGRLPKVIVVSMLTDPNIIKKALDMGAMGFIPKNTDYNELKTAIEAVLNGEKYINPHLANELAHVSAGNGDENTNFQHAYNALSKREKEILKHIALGLTNKQIAEKLFLSPLTVKTHRHNILQKLNLNNTASVVRFITSLGII